MQTRSSCLSTAERVPPATKHLGPTAQASSQGIWDRCPSSIDGKSLHIVHGSSVTNHPEPTLYHTISHPPVVLLSLDELERAPSHLESHQPVSTFSKQTSRSTPQQQNARHTFVQILQPKQTRFVPLVRVSTGKHEPCGQRDGTCEAR